MIYYIDDVVRDLNRILRKVYDAEYFCDKHGRNVHEQRETRILDAIIDAIDQVQVTTQRDYAPTSGLAGGGGGEIAGDDEGGGALVRPHNHGAVGPCDVAVEYDRCALPVHGRANSRT